jgi:hypothetical protein
MWRGNCGFLVSVSRMPYRPREQAAPDTVQPTLYPLGAPNAAICPLCPLSFRHGHCGRETRADGS